MLPLRGQHYPSSFGRPRLGLQYGAAPWRSARQRRGPAAAQARAKPAQGGGGSGTGGGGPSKANYRKAQQLIFEKGAGAAFAGSDPTRCGLTECPDAVLACLLAAPCGPPESRPQWLWERVIRVKLRKAGAAAGVEKGHAQQQRFFNSTMYVIMGEGSPAVPLMSRTSPAIIALHHAGMELLQQKAVGGGRGPEAAARALCAFENHPY